jgi:hypothetical protein
MHEPYIFCMHVLYFFHLPLILVFLLVMHYWVWGIESDARHGDRKNELPPSRGWPYLVENKLILKPRGARS